MGLPAWLAHDLAILLPLYIANAALLLIMRKCLLGRLHALDAPLSLAAFGKSKTRLGLAITILLPAVFYLQALGMLCLLPGIGMALGTHANSMLKRALGMRENSPLPPLDQLDFFIGGLAGLSLCGVHLYEPLLMAFITFGIHLSANMIAYKAGLKDVWW
jgi:CDP-diglyceride synthetase